MNISPEPITEYKRSRGRPKKYNSEQEREEHNKELKLKWYNSHKDHILVHRKELYNHNSEDIKHQNNISQSRGREAIRLLKEILTNNKIEDDIYKNMITDLVVHKKRIYT